MTVILAPFAEEMTYRIGLFSALKRVNLILAFIVTALVFGLIHFDLSGVIQGFNTGTEGSRKYAINELCNLPLYCAWFRISLHISQIKFYRFTIFSSLNK